MESMTVWIVYYIQPFHSRPEVEHVCFTKGLALERAQGITEIFGNDWDQITETQWCSSDGYMVDVKAVTVE